MIRITFATAISGRSYFEKFLHELSLQDRAVILSVFQDIQIHGLGAKGCDFRQLEGKLWEIKIRAPTGGYRFFYVLLASDHLHVLHSYRKQGQKAPTKELELAKKRLREILYEK
ncbi:type II toxin-antitoxin system RelE/ParE family toxin [Bdellovibrio sp. HCB274]|uniref:type II toxin-antitoxin system RelE/ParE family toxin n=1 Tax=Bdellovibrio sp. HCB274 TaxID=3394361 RepID=UPI0039B44621